MASWKFSARPFEGRSPSAETPQLRVVARPDLIRHSDGAALVVRAAVPALDELVVRLVGAGIAVRELTPVVPPLEAAFLALTAAPTQVPERVDRRRAPVIAAAIAPPEAGVRPAPVRRSYQFELLKLLAQWRIRLLLPLCWLVPGLLVAIISQQSSLPVDTVFGRWMSQSGWAGTLVGLSASGIYVLPLVTSLVAGDIFAAEDRLGTWRYLLVAVRSPRRIFAAKVLASLTIILLLLTGLAMSSIAGGLAVVGDWPLVGLDGHQLGSGQAAVAILLAWASALAPTLAFAAVGWLGVAWLGLFTEPAQTGPLVVGVIVSLAWAAAASALAYALFMRRDFTDVAYDGASRGIVLRAMLPLVTLLVVTVGVIAATTPATGWGIDKAKLDGSLVEDVGPGNDWRCVVTWHLPGSSATGSAIYQLDVTPDGRYAADGDGPQAVNGFFQVRTPTGDAPNPLWQFDGFVDLLASTSKG